MKSLVDLIRNVSISESMGPSDQRIRMVQFDHNKVGAGDAYFALVYPGREGDRFSDGHHHIAQAIENGAKVIVCERLPEQLREGLSYLRVEDSFAAMAVMVANFYGNPAAQLKIVGATGTNGKTSVVMLLHELFLKLGRKAGMISTVVDKVNATEIPTDGTTPNAIELNQLWRQMVDAGCEYCFMEVTSHAIFQRRVAMVDFAGTVFTSLTADHIGYHGTFQAYADVKRSFFDDTPANSFIVYNADDPFGAEMVSKAVAPAYAISCRDPQADYYFEVLENSLQGLEIQVGQDRFRSRLAAMFNAYNLMTAYAVALQLGQDRQAILALLPDLAAIPGRFNIVRSAHGVIGVVDFAHNLGALEKLYDLLDSFKTHRLITVIGCGGDRVRQRAKIGKLTFEKSDILVASSDNPRSEEPMDIIRIMLSEVDPNSPKLMIRPDRTEAIQAAVEVARPGDIVLLASKGHEPYQEIKGVKHPFNDEKVLRAQFERLATSATPTN